MHTLYLEPLKDKLKEALQAVLPIIGLVLVLCFSVAPISPSILISRARVAGSQEM